MATSQLSESSSENEEVSGLVEMDCSRLHNRRMATSQLSESSCSENEEVSGLVKEKSRDNFERECSRLLEILETCKKHGPERALNLFEMKSSNKEFYSLKLKKIINILFDRKGLKKQTDFSAIEKTAEVETNDIGTMEDYIPDLTSIHHVGLWAVNIYKEVKKKQIEILRQKLLVGFTFYQLGLVKKLSNRRLHQILAKKREFKLMYCYSFFNKLIYWGKLLEKYPLIAKLDTSFDYLNTHRKHFEKIFEKRKKKFSKNDHIIECLINIKQKIVNLK